jgi:hypothetical protein
VNFVGHVAVGADFPGWSDPAFRLGVVAPDLTGRLGVTLSRDEGPARAGVLHHHRADEAFHGLRWFTETTAGLRATLQASGVARGPARAVAHLGTELLLDGALLADDDVADRFDGVWAALRRGGPDVAALVAGDDRARWMHRVGELTRRLDPYRYADPVYTAERVTWLLSARPRLATAPHDHDAVTDALVASGPGITAAARAVVATVVERIRLGAAG